MFTSEGIENPSWVIYVSLITEYVLVFTIITRKKHVFLFGLSVYGVKWIINIIYGSYMMVNLITIKSGQEIGEHKEMLGFYFIKIIAVRDMCYVPM